MIFLKDCFKKPLTTISLVLLFIFLFSSIAYARPANDYIGSPNENGIYSYYGSNYEYEKIINEGLEDINRIEDQLIPSIKREGSVPLWKGYGMGQYEFSAERIGGPGELIRGNVMIIIQGIYTMLGNMFFMLSKLATLASISVIEFCFSENALVPTILEQLPNWINSFYNTGFSGGLISFVFFIAVFILAISLIFTFIRGQIVNTFTTLFISIIFIALFIFYINNAHYIIKPIMTSINHITAISIAAVENLESDDNLNVEEGILNLSNRLWNNTIGIVWATAQFGTTDIEVLKLKQEEIEHINTDLKYFKLFGKKENLQAGFTKSGSNYTGDYYMDRVYLGGCSETKDKLLEALANNEAKRTGKEMTPVLAVQPNTSTGLNHLFVGFLSLIPSFVLLIFTFSVGFPIIIAEIMLMVMFLIMPILIIIAIAGETGRPVFITYITKFIQFFLTKMVLGFYLALVLTLLSLILLSIKNMAGVVSLGVILLVNTLIFGLAFWYRKKPMEMFLALLSFSTPGSSSRAFENIKGEGSFASRLAGTLALEQYRANKFKKMLNSNKEVPVDEKPPQDIPEQEDNQSNLGHSSKGIYFDETKYQTSSQNNGIDTWANKVEKGDLRGAETLLRQNSPNIKDASGATIPTKIGQIENAQTREKAWTMFTRNKGDLELEDNNKQTAIFHTKTPWETSHVANAGANLEHKDGFGNTPLNHAIKSDNTAKAQTLINKGANLNTKDNQGKTPLINAVEKKDYETVKYLVDKGADVELEDNRGQTARDIARSDEKIITLLNNKQVDMEDTQNEF